MVRTIVAALLLAFALPGIAAPVYRLEPVSIALGEPVTLTLTSRPGTLDKLDLKELARDFEIQGRTLGGDSREESLVLTLYPLHTGRIVLPNLGLRGRVPTLTVNEESETTPRVRLRIETDPENYHVRQPLRLTIEACDDGSLMWQRPLLASVEGVFLRPLNEEQIDLERDGVRCTAHRWHWSVLPTTGGLTTLPVPMLEANKFGQRLRFPSPRVELDALPVPAWLPAEVAIGRPEISVSSIPKQWIIDRPMAWRIEVSGGYSAESLKNLLRVQLANKTQFIDYPPSVEELGSDNGIPRHAVNLYPMFHERGEFKLPNLLFPWYEPGTGTLQQTNVPGEHVGVIDPARQRIVNALLALVVLVFLGTAAYLLWRLHGWRFRRHRAIAGLKKIESIEGLAMHLCGFSLRGESTPADTLGEWQQRMNQDASFQFLEELVASVEAARFGERPFELSDLLEMARRCLASASPKS